MHQPTRLSPVLATAALALSVGLAPNTATAQLEWRTYQGNASHDGYLPTTIDPTKLKLDWSIDLGNKQRLHQVAAANSQVMVSGYAKRLWVLDSATGKIQWTRSYTSASSVNPPGFASGRVFMQTGNHSSDTYLRCFDAESGKVLFESPHGAQWEQYYAPTEYDGVVYVNGGTYGGMYAFDATTGQQLWFRALAQYDEWTPAVDANYAYAFVGGVLSALDKKTGSVAFTIKDPGFSWHGWSAQLALVLGGNEDAFAIENGHLIRFDLKNRRVHYTISGTFNGQPAVRNGVVYAINAGILQARQQTDGKLLWGWEKPSQNMIGEVSVTDSHVLLGSSSHTYLVDLQTHQEVWSVAESGKYSIGQGAIYIAGGAGKLTCVRFGILPRPDVVTPARQHFARPMTSVRIKGVAFSGIPAPTVHFGAKEATDVVVVDDTTITCMPPKSGPGEVDVTVANRLGRRRLEGGFTYIPAVVATGDYRLGGSITLRLECETGAVAVFAIGLETTPQSIPPFSGMLELRAYRPFVIVPRTWTTSYQLVLPIPKDPTLRGGFAGFQALVGPGPNHPASPPAFTDLNVVEVR